MLMCKRFLAQIPNSCLLRNSLLKDYEFAVSRAPPDQESIAFASQLKVNVDQVGCVRAREHQLCSTSSAESRAINNLAQLNQEAST